MRTFCCVTILFVSTALLRAQDMALSQILIPGEEWRKVEGTFKPIKCLTSWSADTVNVWDEDLRLQATINPKDLRVTPTNGDGRFQAERFAIEGGITLVFDRKNRRVLFERGYDKPEIMKAVQLPFAEPSAMWVPPELGTALIADASSKHIWAFRIERSGLSAGEKYMTVRLGKGKTRSDVSDLRTEPAGRVYVATNEGIQVFDPTGRLCGVLPSPGRERVAALCFSGEAADRLYVACGTQIFIRNVYPTAPVNSPARPK